MLAAALAAAGSMFGNVYNAEMAQRSQAAANVANRDLSWEMAQFNANFNAGEAAKSREFENSQAARQMAFQREMSNTAHQREVEDLKKAGINPMLSAVGSGASAPGGASGSSSAASSSASPAVMKSTFSPIDIMGILKFINESDLMSAQADNLRAGAANYNVTSDYTKQKGPREERLANQEILRSQDEMHRHRLEKIKGQLLEKLIDVPKKVLDFNSYDKYKPKTAPGYYRRGMD